MLALVAQCRDLGVERQPYHVEQALVLARLGEVRVGVRVRFGGRGRGKVRVRLGVALTRFWRVLSNSSAWNVLAASVTRPWLGLGLGLGLG